MSKIQIAIMVLLISIGLLIMTLIFYLVYRHNTDESKEETRNNERRDL